MRHCRRGGHRSGQSKEGVGAVFRPSGDCISFYPTSLVPRRSLQNFR
ncbi:MAG: hypothetical protein ACK56F_01120 [bacterium]